MCIIRPESNSKTSHLKEEVMYRLVKSVRSSYQTLPGVIPVIAVFLLSLAVAVTSLPAQSKGAKEAQKFQAQGDNARKGIEKTRDQIKATMDNYNSFLAVEEKKIDSGYKKLSQDVGKCEKMVEDLKKQVENFEKSAEGFFAVWEKELGNFSSDSIRKQSEDNLNLARSGFEGWKTSLSAAGEVYRPFIGSLKDQIQLLGLSLSTDTLASLKKDNAPELNQMADDLFKAIEDILNKEKTSHDQVDQAVDEKPEEEAGDDTEADDASDEEGDEEPSESD
jgi:type II secretory pathway pseudopilin PulG